MDTATTDSSLSSSIFSFLRTNHLISYFVILPGHLPLFETGIENSAVMETFISPAELIKSPLDHP